MAHSPRRDDALCPTCEGWGTLDERDASIRAAEARVVGAAIVTKEAEAKFREAQGAFNGTISYAYNRFKEAQSAEFVAVASLLALLASAPAPGDGGTGGGAG